MHLRAYDYEQHKVTPVVQILWQTKKSPWCQRAAFSYLVVVAVVVVVVVVAHVVVVVVVVAAAAAAAAIIYHDDDLETWVYL